MILRSGALPAGIKYLEELTVGPSLGADSIRAGVRAAVVGMVAVLMFMLIYYHGAGINADIALILNLIILLGFMGYIGATLNIAGNCGRDSDGWYGRGFECADLRAHPRGTAQRQNAAFGRGAGIRPCLDHDCGYARHHNRLGGNSFHLRNRASQRVCGHSELRLVREFVYCSVRLARDLRLDSEPQAKGRGVKHLDNHEHRGAN